MSKLLNKLLTENKIEASLEDAIESAIGNKDWVTRSVTMDQGNQALVSISYAGIDYTAAVEKTKLGTWEVWSWNPSIDSHLSELMESKKKLNEVRIKTEKQFEDAIEVFKKYYFPEKNGFKYLDDNETFDEGGYQHVIQFKLTPGAHLSNYTLRSFTQNDLSFNMVLSKDIVSIEFF